MKLYRWLSAHGCGLSDLFPGVGFVGDSEFELHAEKINKVKAKKDTCGGAAYKAAKSGAIGRKGLSETGGVFCTCRHGYLLRAVDMLKGETYRHVHYLHDFAYRSGCKFLCYDVVCQYWSFAADISEELEEFKCHTKNMQPFLCRWHGKTHAWYCQILFSGHWLKGACLTTGETTEQTNSKMARYSSITKHMGRSNRRDHLTLAMIYANIEKEEVKGEMLQCLKQINEIVKSGSPTQESLARSQKLKESYDMAN
ncbi:hypothetical protein OUZ56_021415 [Daphnia magna]|uniref:Uncharacterized protein n=1 Tax=Daphnia magna TaxID=35525 RepID=A0ABQ9ZHA6_9CRUS|nr:hypothetical protein OUZ56_021415 [Daphnia magna]